MKVVFTNGCFDVLHPGHIDLLERARSLGDRLVVGLNSDASVRAIKGPGRPIIPQEDRALVLRALRAVDEVIVFDEETPARLIEELGPDVLVKGGDWPVEKIVGAESVLRRGGRVVSLPFRRPYSTTALAGRMAGTGGNAGADSVRTPEEQALSGLAEAAELYRRTLTECRGAILSAGRALSDSMAGGGTVFFFGTGGSASTAQRLASELSVGLEGGSRPLAALALTNDVAVLTSIGNDRGFESLFARQLEALTRPGDCAVAISASGSSASVLAGAATAAKRGCRTVGLAGSGGERLAAACETAVLVPSDAPARVHEAHLAVGHLWCRMARARLEETDGGPGQGTRGHAAGVGGDHESGC
jgi:rfaE bifunctional protein nucleotidyltransferase chain/domain